MPMVSRRGSGASQRGEADNQHGRSGGSRAGQHGARDSDVMQGMGKTFVRRRTRPPAWDWRTLAGAAVAIVVLVASCGGIDSTDGLTTTSSSAPSTTSTSVTTTSMSSSTTTTVGPLLEYTLNELLDLRPKREVLVEGFVVQSSAAHLLCDLLAESSPPQCAGRWVVITNPEALDVALSTDGNVVWSDGRVQLLGRLVDGRLALAGTPSGVEVTEADRRLVETFTGFARNGGDPADLPIAPEGLQLGLADRIFLTRSASELADSAAWDIVFEPFRGRVAPFSAFALLADPRESLILVGPHDHCAAPPWPPASGLEDLRHLSIQPIRTSSCLEWFTVDFFVNEEGLVEAITLDLWEP